MSEPNGINQPLVALKSAIKDASRDRLEAVLRALIERCSPAIIVMEDQLLTDYFDSGSESGEEVEEETSLEIEEVDEKEPSTDETLLPANGRKRKRADTPSHSPSKKRNLYEFCIQCKTEYNVLENDSSECAWLPGTTFPSSLMLYSLTIMFLLPGEYEPDYESDFWADHDENCHGTISQLGDEYPEGFLWDCCNKDGTSEGCTVNKHKRMVVD
jgi:hypothetical protein